MDGYQTWLNYIIPLVSIYISHYLGTKLASNRSQDAYKKLRYEKAYVPFIQSLYRGYMFDPQYIPIGREQRDYFLDLLSNNMQYYGPLVLKNYPAFYRAYLDMLEYEDNNFGFDSAPQNYIREFKTISNELLLEATMLESHLKLPGLALTFQMVRSSYSRSNK